MHDRLFEHRLELSDDELRAHAEAVGVEDAARFDADLRDERALRPGRRGPRERLAGAECRARRASS